MRTGRLSLLLGLAAAALVLAAVVAPVGARARNKGLVNKGLAIAVSVGAAERGDRDPLLATITLKNVSSRTITLLSHVATHETHLDWTTVRLAFPVPSDEGCSSVWAGQGQRVLQLDDDRDKSARVAKTLAPGATLTHVVDLRDWAQRARNGGAPITPGFYKIEVEYKVAGEKGMWNGTIRSPRVPFTITGTVPPEMCGTNPGWEYF